MPRRGSSSAAASRKKRAIVITHGTDTMVETARAAALGRLEGKTIVLTGAMVPYAFGSSDGLFNLGSALSFVQVLPPGVYVAMNGRHFAGTRAARTATPASSRASVSETTAMEHAPLLEAHHHHLEAAVGRHDDLHGDVEAGRGSRRDQSVAGISRTSTAIPRWSTRSPGTCARGVTSTRRCRACRRCGRRLPRSSPSCTAPTYDPDTEVTVTSGGTEAIFDSVAAVVQPGDEVIVFEPCYDSYVPGGRAQWRAGGRDSAALSGLPRCRGTRCARR